MNRLTDWIKGHQVTAFYIITFTISWGLAFSLDAALNKGNFSLFPLASIALCGPALAGIIISVVSNTQPRQGRSRTFWIAFVVAWAVSALIFVANIVFFSLAPFSPGLVVVALVTVIPVAFVISMAYSRIPAVKSYLASLIRLRDVWGWCLLALVLYPVLALITNLIGSMLSRQPVAGSQFQATGPALIGLVAVKFFYQLFFYNSTGEEVGWRGFVLPRLQTRFSPLVASLVIAFFWVPWHFFLWQAEGSPVNSWQYWIIQYALHFAASVTIGWFYNRSRGSILVAGIAHAAANTAFAFFANFDWTVNAFTLAVAALVMIVTDRMWKKLPSDHPAVRRDLALDSEEPIIHRAYV